MFDDYSIYEFNEAKSKILKDFGDDFKPIENPEAYMIVGQPGAGKSTLASYFTNKHDKEKNPAEVFKAEFFRKLSEKEINSIYNDFFNYVTKEEISGVINEYKDFEHWLSNANPNYNFR